jgi:MerR family transcriptional regulator/heat shock protein HspR
MRQQSQVSSVHSQGKRQEGRRVQPTVAPEKQGAVRIRVSRGGESAGVERPQPIDVQTQQPIRVSASRQAAPSRVEGVYVISVAARILEMHPQTLRKYERVGLVLPSRSDGSLRLYSDRDIARLKMIKHLVDHWGMNLAGVEVAMGLLDALVAMQEQLTPLMQDSQATSVLHEAWAHMLHSLGLDEGQGGGDMKTTPRRAQK